MEELLASDRNNILVTSLRGMNTDLFMWLRLIIHSKCICRLIKNTRKIIMLLSNFRQYVVHRCPVAGLANQMELELDLINNSIVISM